MTYLLDNEEREARRRLRLLGRIEDPGTFARIERIGSLEGFRCLEVGAGAGTVASWLCERVGPTGRVVATDLETRFLEPSSSPVMEVRRHDIVSDPLESEAFDLVHARHLLVHLPERDGVLEKLARAVRPGGWLLVEEIDHSTDAPDPSLPESMRSLYEKGVGAVYAFVREQGLDPGYGAQLFGAFGRFGLTELSGAGRVHLYRGSEDDASPHVAAFAELRDPIVERGEVTAAQFDDFLALLRDPGFAWREGLTVAVLGRKPLA